MMNYLFVSHVIFIFASLSVADVCRIYIRNKKVNRHHWNHTTIASFDKNCNSGAYEAARWW